MPQNITKAQEEAQRYVDEHGLDRMVTKLMNGIIAEKPEDPKLYMIRWLAERCSDEQLENSGLERKKR
eukprot:symbB.v1.2.007628.t1/scaffold470.1/size199496/5